MKNLSLNNIAKICGSNLKQCTKEAAETEVSGVVLDSRKVQPNYLFIATKGERVDGHQFIKQVMEQGAAGVICQRAPEDETIPYILVEDSFAALKSIAAFYREQLSVKVVGITGSVGKTSTKEFIASVLSKHFSVLKTEGNFNNEIGLPLTILQIRESHEAAVLEMGISDFGEMHRLSEMAKPDVCVMTNIGQCHLENLKTREGILKAKSELFDFMKEDGYVCVNGDDDMLATIEAVGGKKPIRFGLGQDNDVFADQIRSDGLFGSSAVLHMGEEICKVSIPQPGVHMVYNALAAACVGKVFGLSNEEITEGIAGVEPVSGRSNLMKTNRYVLLDDCYNANPASMQAAIQLLALAETRKVAILGDMFELGESSKAYHSQVGQYAMENGADILICIGELSKAMYDSAMELARKNGGGVEHIYHFDTKDGFMSCADVILRDGDTILVKASHGMQFENIILFLKEEGLS